MIDSGTPNSIDMGLTKADIYGPRVAARPQPNPEPMPDNYGPIKNAMILPGKQDWWELRLNLRSMSEYEAMKKQTNL